MKKLLFIVVLSLFFSGSVYSEELKIKCKTDTNTSTGNETIALYVIEDDKLKASGSILSGKPLLFTNNTPVNIKQVNWKLIIRGIREKGNIKVFQIYLDTTTKPIKGYFNATVYFGKYDYPFLPENTTSIDNWKINNNYSLDFFYNWVDNYTKLKKQDLLSKGDKGLYLDSRSSPFDDVYYISGKCNVVDDFL